MLQVVKISKIFIKTESVSSISTILRECDPKNVFKRLIPRPTNAVKIIAACIFEFVTSETAASIVKIKTLNYTPGYRYKKKLK
jgi:hypothetical protein